MNSPLIQLENVRKVYNTGAGAVNALDGVSLSLGSGEFLAVIGQSGSGKTTLMNMLGCLDSPTSGRYLLDGENVSDMSDRRLSEIRSRQIGFIFQSFNLIPSLTALENVELPLRYRRVKPAVRRRAAQEALEQLGLAHRMHHYPQQLSGGQQQRVAIARALAVKPQIILADEPTGNLDSASGREIMLEIDALWRSGKTIVLITHDSSVAAFAPRHAVMCDGKLSEAEP